MECVQRYLIVPRMILRDNQNPLEKYSNTELVQRVRFSRFTITEILLPMVYPQGQSHNNRGVPLPPISKLYLALRFFATGSYQRVCGDLISVSQSLASRIIHEKRLRERFSRERSKIESSTRSGSGAVNLKKWDLYESMLFLTKHINKRQRFNNVKMVTKDLSSTLASTQELLTHSPNSSNNLDDEAERSLTSPSVISLEQSELASTTKYGKKSDKSELMIFDKLPLKEKEVTNLTDFYDNNVPSTSWEGNDDILPRSDLSKWELPFKSYNAKDFIKKRTVTEKEFGTISTDECERAKKVPKKLFGDNGVVSQKHLRNTDYGPSAEQTEEDSEIISLECSRLLKNLEVTCEERDKIQINTIGQSGNDLYESERKFRLTASVFGRVIKKRAYTSCHNITMNKELIITILVLGVVWGAALSCISCGSECESACGTRHFKTCCFNYLRKRSPPSLLSPAMDPSLRLELWLAKERNSLLQDDIDLPSLKGNRLSDIKEI
ncbi:hypothetical protein RN001_005752 [Aquatica leii]|uniref:Uncharacterized protein n=1 Tax=Aquatica leii TaxID=1421715 RepID=A0AAN7SPY5_9COLE|nr:hypothetical protein RN001_005752 [Aquatica leii]